MSVTAKKVLFVKTGSLKDTQMYAIDHYSILAKKNGYSVAMLGPTPAELIKNGVQPMGNYPAINKTNIVVNLKRLVTLVKGIRQYKPDIVHVKNHIGCSLVPLVAKIFSPKSRVVLDIRTMSPNARKDMILKSFRRITGTGFDHVFGLNNKILEAYVNNKTRKSLLPLGYDPKIFKPTKHVERFEPGGTLRCIYYGSMNRVRKLENLIRGLLCAIDEGVDIRAEFIGKGDDKHNLISIIPERYRKRIIFRSFVKQSEIANTIGKYHLGLAYVPNHPSLAPNLPLKTVEMIACGVPVLATATEGNLEIVINGKNGIVIEDKVDSVCKILREVSTGHNVMHIDKQSIAESASQYTWDKLAEKYLFPVYENLLRN